MNVTEERRKIQDGTYSKRVVEGRQRKHIKDTVEFVQNRSKMQSISPGSEPAILTANASDLVLKYSGKGHINITKGSQYPREVVDTESVVGKTWVKSLKKYVDTKRIKIFYSSDGVHVVPVNDYMDLGG